MLRLPESAREKIMRLKSLQYKENVDRADANPWELQEISLGEHNLIVAKNATGKTRILTVLHNLAISF
jgi:hypothetical protein